MEVRPGDKGFDFLDAVGDLRRHVVYLFSSIRAGM